MDWTLLILVGSLEKARIDALKKVEPVRTGMEMAFIPPSQIPAMQATPQSVAWVSGATHGGWINHFALPGAWGDENRRNL